MKMNWFIFAAIVSISAQAQQWTFQSGKQTNNGPVTVKSVDGSTAKTATQNPTGAAARVNQTAVTQPPLMVMQATARLPVVFEGGSCNSATDQAGIKADLSVLYSCQSNTWTRLTYNIPTVTEGSACGAHEKIAVTAGNAKSLLCQGGVWKAPSGGNPWSTMAGRTISCGTASGWDPRPMAYAYVDNNGVPYARVVYGSYRDTGWTTSSTATTTWDAYTFSSTVSLQGVTLGINGTTFCNANW